MKRLPLLFLLLLSGLAAQAQPARTILRQEAGSITFAVDKVDLPDHTLGRRVTGDELAREIYSDPGDDIWAPAREPDILFNSFAGDTDLYAIGEDVVFKMLLDAWCQHRPVSLSPDVVWLLICQQFSHYVNHHPEEMRDRLVFHEGKMELTVKSDDLLSGEADWAKLIDGFTDMIGRNTREGLAATLVADFSTTGPDERIASEVTLMDVTKSYFDYVAVYAVCGIPSITLTGTPDDWEGVLARTRTLGQFGLSWWTVQLEPILEQFIDAAEGKPDYWFWKDIVKKSRPRTVKGPTCGRRRQRPTEFDGWFLTFFPFNNDGRTPEKVIIGHSMLPETVTVPFTYRVVDGAGAVLSETPLELVAGIVGVRQDTATLTLTPRIGWFVRKK